MFFLALGREIRDELREHRDSIIKADLNRLDDIMKKYGMIRAEQWDYERVSYDRKFIIREGTYYLRVQAYAVEGDVDTFDAHMQLMTPILGKHYYPHGV